MDRLPFQSAGAVGGGGVEQALDPEVCDGLSVASPCSAVRTFAVTTRTMLLLVRLRFQLRIGVSADEPILCEAISPLACTGSAEAPAGFLRRKADAYSPPGPRETSFSLPSNSRSI